MADAFETIRHHFFLNGRSLQECYEIAFPRFARRWEWMDPPEREYKDFINCWAAVEAYFNEYPPATDYFQPYIKDDGSPAVEFKVAIPMGVMHPDTGDPILYSGRVDFLAQNEPNSCYVVDEKTTKAMGPSWPYQWDMRGQFYGYVYAMRHLGFPCAGALVRGIAIQQTQFKFAEKPIFYRDDQLELWWREANKKAARAVEMYERAKEWEDFDDEDSRKAMHYQFDKSFGDACSSYGGCQFTDLCLHPDPFQIYGGWEERVWDPLAQDPTSKSENRLKDIETQTLEELMAGM